jgi:phenylalanyl-tRNA synthetase beta subunit
MITAIKALNIPELRDIRLLDLYQGPELPKRRVSLTVRLTFADPVRTLTQVEVSGYSEQIFSLLRSDFAAEARSQSFGSGID